MKQGEHNAIILPDNHKGQAGIIFGIEDYPALEETRFWKKTIEIPNDGILITSTKQEEIPNTTRYYFKNGKIGDYNRIFWDANLVRTSKYQFDKKEHNYRKHYKITLPVNSII